MLARRHGFAASLAIEAALLFALACGSKSGLKDASGTGGSLAGGGHPGSGGASAGGGGVATGGVSGVGGGPASGGTPGTGGRSAGGGSAGTGGVAGTGGRLGTGGSTRDAGAGVVCTDDGGVGLPAAARKCAQDSDCTIAIAGKCCGPDFALGENPAQSATYASCLELPPGACNGLGCAKYLGYLTDTGRVTPVASASENPIARVSVHCQNQLCTTDVLEAQDGGVDAPVVDAAVEIAPQRCGDAGACGAGQACILIGGGPVPPCTPPSDAGTCPSGQVIVSSCPGYGGAPYAPGCTTPAPSPHCAQLADGCDNVCACVCPVPAGLGCYQGPGYMICSLP